jgi:Zn-finger protein
MDKNNPYPLGFFKSPCKKCKYPFYPTPSLPQFNDLSELIDIKELWYCRECIYENRNPDTSK